MTDAYAYGMAFGGGEIKQAPMPLQLTWRPGVADGWAVAALPGGMWAELGPDEYAPPNEWAWIICESTSTIAASGYTQTEGEAREAVAQAAARLCR